MPRQTKEGRNEEWDRQKKEARNEEWDRQKARIKEIFDRNDKGGERLTVAKLREIMKRDHLFDAPLWQYESKLREWNMKRNGSLEDWAVVIGKVDELRGRKETVRVLISSHVVEEEKINRNRLRANRLKASGKQLRAFDEWRSDPRSRYMSIEIEHRNGEWVLYTGDQSADVMTTTTPAPQNALAIFDWSDSSLSQHAETNVRSPLPPQGNPPPLSPSCAFVGFDLNIPSSNACSPSLSMRSWLSLGQISHMPEFGMQQSVTHYETEPWMSRITTPSLISYQSGSLMHGAQQAGSQSNGFGTLQPTSMPVNPWSSSLRMLVQSVLRDALPHETSLKMAEHVPLVDELLDGLDSLNPLSWPSEGTLSSIDAAGEVTLKLKIAIFKSIVNGFTSIPRLPTTSVIQLVKTQSGLWAQLAEYLQKASPTAVRHLANNLFRTAVEACDAPSLMMIIYAMESRGEPINPDKIICKCDGKRYTPVEHAAYLQNPEVVRILTKNLKSDVTKTYDSFVYKGEGPPYGLRNAADPSIALDLLRAGAKVDLEVAADIVSRFGRTHQGLVAELLTRLPTWHDGFCADSSGVFTNDFDCRWGIQPLFSSIIVGCEVEFAIASIRRLFEGSWSSSCSRTSPAENPAICLFKCLNAAARRADMLVCKFLLDFTPMSYTALQAAISATGGNPVVELFLRQSNISKVIQSEPKYSQTTALAEAVRRRDLSLAAKLESCGAWKAAETNIRPFIALLLAAIETDASDYLARLLKIWNDRLKYWMSDWKADLFHVIFTAIELEKSDAALLLLDSAIRIKSDLQRPRRLGEFDVMNGMGILLKLALTHQNEAIVDVLLESDLTFQERRIHLPERRWWFVDAHISAISLAWRWKGLPLVDELIRLGCPLTGALEEAVEADDLELVKVLLVCNAKPETPGALLLKALMRRNREMIQFLIESGAEDPASNEALHFAIGADAETLELLMDTFRTKYPNGRSGFGADWLIKALEINDIPLLYKLLRNLKLAVNSRSYEKKSTPLGFTIRSQCLEQVRVLLEEGADIGAIAEWPSERQLRNMDGHPQTALQVGIRTRSLQMVNYLVEKGADISLPARRGLKLTPLQTACEVGSYKIAEYLLKRGANANDPPAYYGGGTALQFAAIRGNPRIVELLLNWQADIHAAPSKYHGRTVLQGAAEHGRIQVLDMLWAKGNGFPDEEIRMAQEFANENNNPACAEHLTWLSEGSPARGKRRRIDDVAHTPRLAPRLR
ncbi:hypothetical protein QBC43DRAFT_268063 [Cladorrhinum sp. PSN259]|nr:hypothetical protein QBC43DRAFT_268063 [Cladorrhinum sp. PSN259]